ncbi:MAG TPA: NAD-dependent epimerase/dehydratase family protein [Candidatus Saccharimonadales bacterium]|nr:NAD-dependent epimerase/dehydratase family protein [Candidatus Saccharimonadales bacterium]
MALLNKKGQLRVLITGSRGFIGTNLIKKLQKTLDMIPLESAYNERINILERAKLHKVENIDLIFHLASKTSIPNSTTHPYETYLTNIMGTLNILDFAIQNRIKKIINFSTYVYGQPKYLPINENHPIAPHSPYTKSKLIAENLCEYYAQDYGLDIVTLRPFYIYGPSSNNGSFIPSIIKQINQKGKVILSSKNIKRDFLFIDDFIRLIENIAINFPRGYNVYNVGFGKSYSLEEVVEIIKEILKTDIEVEYNDSIRPNDIHDMVADTILVQKLYSWKPDVDIKTGIRLTVDDIIGNCS